MKKIEAIINPFKVDDVRDALHKIGIQGMSVIQVEGFGRQRGHQEFYPKQNLKNRAYTATFVPKVMIQIVLPATQVKKVVATILSVAKTGNPHGDGKVFVSTVEEAYSITTGEKGEKAVLP